MRRTSLFPALIATAVATLPGAAQATSTTCSTTTVCAEYINTSSASSGGVAIHGEANGGIGVRGTSVSNTGFYGASGSGSYLTPGVEGESPNTQGSAAGGAFGLAFYANPNDAPTYGVMGFGSFDGTYGQTTHAGNDFGAEGYDNENNYSNGGVRAYSEYGTGMLAEGSGTPTLSLYATGLPIGMYAVADKNGATNLNEAIALVAESNSYAIVADNTSANTQTALGEPSVLIDAYNTKSNATLMIVDNSGNEQLAGTLSTSKGMYARTVGASGIARIAYGARLTTPEIEDIGEGTMSNGRAVVTIDASFGDSIDPRSDYHVFLTPKGDCNGLYVTNENASGFTVRELHGGRSSLAFDYRIVAKPHDDNGSRLALAPALAQPAGLPRGTRTGTTMPVSADQRLGQRIGPQAFARAVADIRQRLNAR